MAGAQFVLQPGDAGIGVHLKDDNQTVSTAPGIPEHRIIHAKGIVTFGVPRILKADQRNSTASVATQVYNFISQNPQWYPNTVYRPVFDVTVDDIVALALMNKEHRAKLLVSGTKLMALLSELNEWGANRYNFVKNPQPRLINAVLAYHQYPFYDHAGKTRTELCELTLLDMVDMFMRCWDDMEPQYREYPDDLKFETLHSTDKAAMLRVKGEKYGAEDLIVQQFFQSNPGIIRVIMLRRVKNTTKHAVTAYNASMYDSKLQAYRYVDTKSLNIAEKQAGGEPEWKNLKLTILGPRRGSTLTPEVIWSHGRI